MPTEELRKEPMMAHLMDSLEAGRDIGHYGRLIFVMVGRHFLPTDEVLEWLKKDPDSDEEKSRGLVEQVEARDYNPPKRERILEWMRQQEFPICPDAGDASQCNVYRNLIFPEELYAKIQGFYQAKE